jgi:hypothetical protein
MTDSEALFLALAIVVAIAYCVFVLWLDERRRFK